ncbi:MAG: hypothetical protein HKN49_14060, partial [Gammaproteobacteria bacterium]|nr:hypothetical protein [Gammaproteobacteria bacterium]
MTEQGQTLRSRQLARLSSMLLMSVWLTACGGGSSPSSPSPSPPPAPPPTSGPSDPMATGFEAGELTPDGSGKLTLGEGNAVAGFTSGNLIADPTLSRSGNGSWGVGAGTTATIAFETPATAITLWFRNEVSAGPAPADCTSSDDGLDNTSAFGGPLYARGAFNDWANPTPAAPYQFYNKGDHYAAQFELAAGDFEFKLADADWLFEYAIPGETALIATPFPLIGVASGGGPNSTLVVPQTGCYTWELHLANEAVVPAPIIDLLVVPAQVSSGVIRVYDTENRLLAYFRGITGYAEIDLTTDIGAPGIDRIEVENVTDGSSSIGWLLIDDFRFDVDSAPPGGAVPQQATAVLTGFDSMPVTASPATGWADFAIDPDSGLLSGALRIGGTQAIAVELRLQSNAIVD